MTVQHDTIPRNGPPTQGMSIPFSAFKIASQTALTGGLRCTTFSQALTCEVVVKIGGYRELCAQQHYLEALPPHLQRKFAHIYGVTCTDFEQDLGLAVIEKIPGVSLHDFLVSSRYETGDKIEAVRRTLGLLALFFTGEPTPTESIERDPALWLDKIRRRYRLAATPVTLRHRAAIDALLDALGAAIEPERIAARHIHGDAQAGNFIVDSSAQDALEIVAIDPLGGSGRSPGDYVYDLSRLYHWIDCVAHCYEMEKNPGSAPTASEAGLLWSSLRDLVRTSLAQHATAFRDRNAGLWFFLYAACHVTGKLHNFGSEAAQEKLCAAMSNYLKAALRILRYQPCCL
ncbi:phosphotransferase [Trinickia terrae]|nr:phosphotransferase [Trinickia terrae]